MGHEGTAVIIATRGRAGLVRALVAGLAGQSRPPDHVFVVGSRPEDVAGLADGPGRTVRVGRTGLPLQRNDGLALAGGRFAQVVFFDDDFLPSRFWLERCAALFAAHPEVAGLTGTVLADGAKTPGIPLGDGRALVEARDAAPPGACALHTGFGPYGCNMAFRGAAIAGLAFDERLPLYAWLEDSDFGGQVARRGLTARADALWGVHLGDKTGRERGVRIGYAQVANTAYLMRKGTLSVRFLADLMARNMAANLLRSIRPEPFVDRRGRLRGNLIALGDLLRTRITPERAASL